MGLDMHLQGHRYLWADSEMEEGFPCKEKIYELAYWRKHPNLHGYIVQSFADGVDDCRPIELGQEHIQQIMAAIRNKQLPHTEGFFFGTSRQDREQCASDLAIFTRALFWVQADDPGAMRSIRYVASW